MHATLLLGLAGLGLIAACTEDYDQFDFSGSGGTSSVGGGGAAAGGAGLGGAGANGGAGLAGGSGAEGGMAGGGGAGAAPQTVPCGPVECPVGTGSVCCMGDGPPTCEETTDCGGGETTIHCNGPEDCPRGETCCGQLDNFEYEEIICEESCGGGGEVVMCDPDAADPCPGPDDCQPSMILPPGYFTCQ